MQRPPGESLDKISKWKNSVSDGHDELDAGVEGGELVRVAAGVPLRQPGHPQAAAASAERPVPIPPATDATTASGARVRVQQARIGHHVNGERETTQ